MELTDPQIDFIFRMYAKDHPDEVTYRAAGKERPTLVLQQWIDRLEGDALDSFNKRKKDFIVRKISDTYDAIGRVVSGKKKRGR